MAVYCVVINCAVVWQYTVLLQTVQWCGSILCCYKLCSDVAVYCVVINCAVVWQYTVWL